MSHASKLMNFVWTGDPDNDTDILSWEADPAKRIKNHH